ncbi:hypothetical protein OG323_06130 [Streptomyces cyaneofuscatus]|uniref:hypothetical protein n=1 Tax=Streptomyces cyaneofuscatus TaxID=66883 RepID=UPI003866B4EC|nr:hypothetical protein OG323_06130 [Streptomyces cyaneofuscatus]
MATRKPRNPWRVIITGPDVGATSDHTSEANAYTLVRAVLGGDSPAEQARIEYWESGAWRWFETVTADEIP